MLAARSAKPLRPKTLGEGSRHERVLGPRSILRFPSKAEIGSLTLAGGTQAASDRHTMNTGEYFQALSQEIKSLQNRMRNFIGGAHWLTDGEWKESVVRSMLRRHIPKSVEIGRGFIVTATGNSRQIDVLLYSADAPVLFRDGDLVFVTPDAVLGIIEVKSKLTTAAAFREAVGKLAENAELAARNSPAEKFFGIFLFESELNLQEVLADLATSAAGNPARVIDLVCLGDREFIRWSKADPHLTCSVPKAVGHWWRVRSSGSDPG
jgi:hypothetical protein